MKPMKEIGSLVKCMVMELAFKIMVENMKGLGKIIWEMDKVHILGLIMIIMLEIGKIIRDLVKENSNVQKEDIKENGKMIIEMEKESFNTNLVIYMKDNGLKTKKKVNKVI